MNSDRSDYTWAIAAIGAALVALFLAAGLSGAFGHGIPTQLLMAGGALVGGLVGIVVPAPGANRAAAGASVIHTAATTAAATKAAQIAQANPADAGAAQTAAQDVAAITPRRSARARTAISAAIAQHADAAANATAGAAAQVKQAAAAGASNAEQAAIDAASATLWDTALDGGKVLVPGIVFVVALIFGLLMSVGSITYHHCHVYSALGQGETQAPCAGQLFGAANALITLAATTAGTIVGLFAPSPK